MNAGTVRDAKITCQCHQERQQQPMWYTASDNAGCRYFCLPWMENTYRLFGLIIIIKISPIRHWRPTLQNWRFCQVQSHADTKTRTNIKNPARSNLDIVPYFKNQWSVASSHCKWRRRQLLKIAGFPTSKGSWPWPTHTVVHHSSTSTYMPDFIEIEETFCGQTDACTHVRTDIWDRLD